MKGRWLPFLATTAALALAVVAPAQDRGRGRGGGGGGGSPARSEPSRPSRNEPARSEPSRPSRNEPARSEPSRPSRNEPQRNEPSRPSRNEPSRPSSPSQGGGDRSPSRPDNRPGRDPGVNRPNYPSRGGGSFDRGSNTRSRPSRSGTVQYGTRSNGFGDARAVRYPGSISRATLNSQIRRYDARQGANVRYGGVYGGLRVGYVGYNSYWRDDFFCYPYYVFNPWTPNVYTVASPWYRYSYLPPYINSSRTVVINNYYPSYGSDGWNNYDYNQTQGNQRNDDIADSLDDLRDAFERNSVRYAERLVPQTGQVAIFNDGKYDYSLAAADFQDMFLDGIEQSKTARYEIIESKTRGNEVQIRARHEYIDSWGANQVVFHTYTLRNENGRFVIREFGTD